MMNLPKGVLVFPQWVGVHQEKHKGKEVFMDEEKKKQIAVFRFGVISDFVNRSSMARGEQERLLREKCARSWQIPFSTRTRLAPSTILSWIRHYKEGGGRLESLYPHSRRDGGQSRAIDEDTVQSLLRLRKELINVPVTTVITEAHRRRLVPPGTPLPLSTVYRLFHHHGLMDHQDPPPIDRRRYEAESPNDIWQSDTMHGPMVEVDGKRRKSYLCAFIDDMSRLIPHVQFYPSETLDCFLDALRQALLKRGLPRKLYVDNGPAFRSKHLEEITASLGIALAHSQPYMPQGRGKIERWFRTIRTQFLPGFRGHTIQELNEALDCWIRDIYHNRTHSATGQSPLTRFADHMECVRPAPKDLEDYFRKRARRRVAKDRTISLNAKLYEAPVTLIGQQVTLLYHAHDPVRVEITHKEQSYGFVTPLDLHINCRVRRDHDRYLTLQVPSAKPITGGKLPLRAQRKEDGA
jgi:putative transposase